MNLTKQEKQRLRKIYQKAQDYLYMGKEFFCPVGKSRFCCHAIDRAEGENLGATQGKSFLSYRYFCYIFKPEFPSSSAWFSEFGTKDKQQCRLMALQLCELSL